MATAMTSDINVSLQETHAPNFHELRIINVGEATCTKNFTFVFVARAWFFDTKTFGRFRRYAKSYSSHMTCLFILDIWKTKKLEVPECDKINFRAHAQRDTRSSSHEFHTSTHTVTDRGEWKKNVVNMPIYMIVTVFGAAAISAWLCFQFH